MPGRRERDLKKGIIRKGYGHPKATFSYRYCTPLLGAYDKVFDDVYEEGVAQLRADWMRIKKGIADFLAHVLIDEEGETIIAATGDEINMIKRGMDRIRTATIERLRILINLQIGETEYGGLLLYIRWKKIPPGESGFNAHKAYFG